MKLYIPELVTGLMAGIVFSCAPAVMILQDCRPPLPPASPETGPARADISLPEASPEATAACAQLARLGCPEGQDQTCAVVLDKQASMGISLELTRHTITCLAAATTKLDMRACSRAVECP